MQGNFTRRAQRLCLLRDACRNAPSSAPIKLHMLVEDSPWQISRGAHIKLQAPLADFTAVLKIKLHTPLEDFPAVLDVCLRLERLVKQNAPL